MTTIASRNNLYLFLAKNEHKVAIVGGILALCTPLITIYPLFAFSIASLLLFFIGIHPASVGLSVGYFSGHSTLFIRYFALSSLLTFFFLSYPLHPFQFIDILIILFIELWWRGYYVEFMLRKNFPYWIAIMFPALLSLLPYSTCFDFTLSDIGFMLSLFVVVSVVRVATKNVLDGLIWLVAGILIRYTYLHF